MGKRKGGVRHPSGNFKLQWHHDAMYAVVKTALWLLLVAPVTWVFAQDSPPAIASGVKSVASPPTARNFGYPQSLFVDSHNGNIWVADFDHNRVMRFDVSTLTDVDGEKRTLRAEQYALAQNYPNPFNPNTTITFAMRNTEPATVKVYDVLGREVATLFADIANAHELYSLSFSGTDLPSGIYFYRLSSSSRNEARKMGLLK